MKPVNEQLKQHFPTWAKILIGAMALSFGLIIGLLIATGFFIKDLYDKGHNLPYKKSIACAIAGFPDSLPPGFTFGTATDFLNVKTVIINHQPEQMDISFSEIDLKNAQMKNALDANFEARKTADHFEKTVEGTIKIADHKMEYLTGYKTIGNNKLSILDGRITDIPDKFISITAYSAGSKPFDLTIFQKLAGSIKSVGQVNP